jgi:hypothetical protein
MTFRHSFFQIYIFLSSLAPYFPILFTEISYTPDYLALLPSS